MLSHVKQLTFTILPCFGGQTSRCGLAGCLFLMISYRVTVKALTSAVVFSKGSSEGRSASRFTHVAVGRFLSLAGCWAHQCRLPTIPCNMGLSLGQLVSIRGKLQERESKKLLSFCNPISEVTCHDLCLFYL